MEGKLLAGQLCGREAMRKGCFLGVMLRFRYAFWLGFFVAGSFVVGKLCGREAFWKGSSVEGKLSGREALWKGSSVEGKLC